MRKTDPNREPKTGRFTLGNQVARKAGLYQRCSLLPHEQRQSARIRKDLREGGLAPDVAASMAVQWLAAARVLESFMKIADPEEQFERWPLVERACAIQRSVLDRRDRAMSREEPTVPLWQEYSRRAGGERE